jgi:hypothetical protein
MSFEILSTRTGEQRLRVAGRFDMTEMLGDVKWKGRVLLWTVSAHQLIMRSDLHLRTLCTAANRPKVVGYHVY